MAITKQDLDAFHKFAEATIADRSTESLHELVEIWESEQATPELHAENVAAVRAAIRDMKNGDKGRPAADVIQELRSELADQRKQ
jgi:hypothetical protein